MFSMDEGNLAVKMARDVLDRHVRGEDDKEYALPDLFSKKTGAFVTLQMFPNGRLRGCIGYPYPVFPLAETIERAAKSAATADPRFPSVREDELEGMVVEVSLLSQPVELTAKKRKDLPKMIEVG